MRIFGVFLKNFGEIGSLLEEDLEHPSIGAQQFVVRRLRTSIKQRIRFFEATVASKQPRRSDLTSDLKSMAQTTYTTMFVWTVLTSFWNLTEERKKKERGPY